jgi:hypothetical protein
MVFVHSRKETGKTGRVLAEMAGKVGVLDWIGLGWVGLDWIGLVGRSVGWLVGENRAVEEIAIQTPFS